ncbi:hypothetical protein [Nonomuraea sp. NPDC048916]|uniref:hypothetical protein n=1 Tax=Nonomuraea sp. NPDC048916 TaxID=3154232 RepID=UPI0033E7BC85
MVVLIDPATVKHSGLHIERSRRLARYVYDEIIHMQAILTALIAVGGTLLGSFMTYTFQRHTTSRTERFTRAERLRQERMVVYSAFAGAVLEFRYAQRERIEKRRTSHNMPDYQEAKAESYRRRAAAWQALYRVRLVCDEPQVIILADKAMDLTASMDDLDTREEVMARTTEIRKSVEEFISASSSHVR